jgi:hypothetical protein
MLSVLLAFTASGCGTASLLAPKSAPETVRAFLRAAAARDGSTACGFLNSYGRGVMGVYPARFGDPSAQKRSCEQTVSQLGHLPEPQDWRAMARGTNCVASAAGLDDHAVFVSWRHAAHVRANSRRFQ